MEQYTLEGDTVVMEDIPPPPNPNKYKRPVEMYGPGPAGETCRTCANRIEGRYRTKYLHKCPEWILSHSEVTDIRLKWPACGRWKARETP